MMIDTDASLIGWGAVCSGVCTGGLWSPEERKLHINHLELLAGSFAVQAFTKDKRNITRTPLDGQQHCSLLCQQDGGTRSSILMEQACHLWQWCLQRGITLSAEYLPGVNNQVADRESRLVQTSAEWKLHETIFQEVCQRLGPCQVDLFASRLNNQLDCYVSWRPDPFATDALQISWIALEGCICLSFICSDRSVSSEDQDR